MSTKQQVSQLSPDGFSRFFTLCDILQQAYGGTNQKIRILDVGGASEFLEQQLKTTGLKYDLTILDIVDKPSAVKATYVKGDATNMTFKDKYFDVVLSTDVFEHIAPGGKQAFLSECLRVAKELCIIAAPFDTEGVHDAEIATNNFNKNLFGKGQNWLEEHFTFGKPKIETVIKTLTKKKIAYDSFGTQNITIWLLNTHINLIDAKFGLSKTSHTQVNELYNQNILYMNDAQKPTYRHFFIMYLDASKQKRVDISKYTSGVPDMDKITRYISALVSLCSERIRRLRRENKNLSQKLWEADEQMKQLEERYNELNAVTQGQAEILKRWDPILRLAYNRPLNRVRLILNGKIRKGHQG